MKKFVESIAKMEFNRKKGSDHYYRDYRHRNRLLLPKPSPKNSGL